MSYSPWCDLLFETAAVTRRHLIHCRSGLCDCIECEMGRPGEWATDALQLLQVLNLCPRLEKIVIRRHHLTRPVLGCEIRGIREQKTRLEQ